MGPASKSVVIVGAGPCGLVALKEMREAGHDAVILEKGPGIGGAFCRSHDEQYENLYLTISNMFMAFSDFPPLEPGVSYSSKDEYGRYLEAYADHFNLRAHIRLNTRVVKATETDEGWRVTSAVGDAEETHDVDALVVATGANHIPHRPDLEGFTGDVMHSSEYRSPRDLAGKRVLIIGTGESASDIAADISAVAEETVVWSRSPLSVAPRFPGPFTLDEEHDELDFMKDPERRANARVSDFLEVITTSRMANAAPMYAYSTVRHAIWGVASRSAPAAGHLSTWCRQSVANDRLRGDQASVPTKNARLATEAARGRVRVVVSETATFDGSTVTFPHCTLDGGPELLPRPRSATAEDIDVAILCTGYTPDFSWINAPGLDRSPRAWFKHCFPPGLGDKLMFMGWARPHQGGIPACADLLSRYAAMVLAGTRTLPRDYAARAKEEAQAEAEFYRNSSHVETLVDYPAFSESVADLIGCRPKRPEITEPAKLMKWWAYPNWPFWYRTDGPGATPEVLDGVLSALPLRTQFKPDPFLLMTLLFSLLQQPINALLPKRTGLTPGWTLRPKRSLLHGNR